MALYPEGSEQRQEIGAIHDEIEAEIKTVGKSLNSPKDYIAHLQKLLREPQRQVSARSVLLKLDRMGIVVDDRSKRRINAFSLAEFELSNGKKWVATWASVGRTGGLPAGSAGA